MSHNDESSTILPESLLVFAARRCWGFILLCTLALIGLGAPATSFAQSAWSSVGAGCVPTGQTIESSIHFNMTRTASGIGLEIAAVAIDPVIC